MERDEHRRADALDRYWDARLRGSRQSGNEDVDRIEAAIIDRITFSPPEPGTNAAQLKVRQRIVAAASMMEDTMTTATLTDAKSSIPGLPLRSPRFYQHDLVHRLAIAAVLLLTLGLGYAWIGPRQAQDPPTVVPASVLLTEEASPTADTFAYQWNNHPVSGLWQLDNDPAMPGVNITWAVFDKLGNYREIESSDRTIIGSWRATGERQAEVIFVIQTVGRQDLFAAEWTPVAYQFTSGMELWRITASVDESGNTMTLTGSYEGYDTNGTRIYSADYNATAVRMTAVTTEAAATPSP